MQKNLEFLLENRSLQNGPQCIKELHVVKNAQILMRSCQLGR